MTEPSPVPDRQASIIAGLLIVAMIFFGAAAKHDNPSWNRMITQAKAMTGLNRPVVTKTPDEDKPAKKTAKKAASATTPDDEPVAD